jgi:hypothetical protein
MRTTISIDDDVLMLARSLADARGISLGEAVSYLARRGATSPAPTKTRNGFKVFDLEAQTPRFGTREIRDALDEGTDIADEFRSSRER